MSLACNERESQDPHTDTDDDDRLPPSIQIRVLEAKQRDIGKGRARISPVIIEQLGAAPGDTIEIIGTRTSCARIWPADEDEKQQDIMRIDGQTRKNAKVTLNGIANIRKVHIKPAKTISLITVNESVSIDKAFPDFVKKILDGMPISYGDEISVFSLGNYIDFKVDRIAPMNIAKIAPSTILNISVGDPSDLEFDTDHNNTYKEEVGGLSDTVKAMRDIIGLPLKHPELFARFGIDPHGGILLYGPPGCGKTLLARALASESGTKMFLINGPEIMNKYYGETEAKLRDIFKEAKERSPSIIFIDEIDAIAPKREEAYGDVEKRVVAQLLALMDGLTDRGNVIVLGATNRPNVVDPALRRPGRFDREFEISVPNEDGRLEILEIHTRSMPIDVDVDLATLASKLHGYTGADIRSLCREAALKSIRRHLPEVDPNIDQIPSEILGSMVVSLTDFHSAMYDIVPTAIRELYIERPRIHWKDIGGLVDIKTALSDNLVVAIKEPERFIQMGVTPPNGALLYGPPGCGKTLLARALAAETGVNMILVRCPEILSKWVGESEKAIREIFRKARTAAPCVVILDELDSIAHQRFGGGGGDASFGGNDDSHGGLHTTTETLMSQLLTEIEENGATSRVVTVGITNRPDVIDTALLRMGRLDLTLYVAPPDDAGRLEILQILTNGMPLTNVKLQDIVVATLGYTGADLAALCREAAISAMKNNRTSVTSNDFTVGFTRIRASITEQVNSWYDTIREDISNVVPKPRDRGAFYG